MIPEKKDQWNRINISQKHSHLYMNTSYMTKCRNKKRKNWLLKREYKENFPGGTRIGICLPTQGTQVCSVTAGRSHMLRSKQTHAPQPLSQRHRARLPQLLKPASPRTCAPQPEAPEMRSPHTTAKSSPPCHI